MEEKKQQTEKRRHDRYGVSEQPEYTIRLRTPEGTTLQNTVTMNISYGGMMFMAAAEYTCDTRIETVIQFSDNEKPDILLPGTVRWSDAGPESNDREKKYCTGIQFDDMPEPLETEFRSFIDTLIISG